MLRCREELWISFPVGPIPLVRYSALRYCSSNASTVMRSSVCGWVSFWALWIPTPSHLKCGDDSPHLRRALWGLAESNKVLKGIRANDVFATLSLRPWPTRPKMRAPLIRPTNGLSCPKLKFWRTVQLATAKPSQHYLKSPHCCYSQMALLPWPFLLQNPKATLVFSVYLVTLETAHLLMWALGHFWANLGRTPIWPLISIAKHLPLLFADGQSYLCYILYLHQVKQPRYECWGQTVKTT